MKPHHLFLLLFFFLASCAPSMPAPTATPIPTSTSTLTPIPTATQTATATSTPIAWIAIAEEYGMPESMVQEFLRDVEAKDIEFIENENPYVNGITVVADGKDIAFRNDEPISQKEGFELPLAERWVMVDAFEGSKDVDNIPETINYDQLISVEMSNLLYYYASKWQPDVENTKPADIFENQLMGVEFMLVMPDSAPFERNPGLIMNVDLPDNGVFTEHVFVPIIYFDLQTQKAYPVKVVIGAGAEVRKKVLDKWAEMDVMLLITDFSEDKKYPAQETTMTEELYANTEFPITERFKAFA